MTTVKTGLQLKNWGNSQGVRLPKDILKRIDVCGTTETHFSVEIMGKSIILTPEDEVSALTNLLNLEEKEEEEVQKYEYEELVVDSRNYGKLYTIGKHEYCSLISALQDLGKEGWELAIKESDTKYILKRKLV